MHHAHVAGRLTALALILSAFMAGSFTLTAGKAPTIGVDAALASAPPLNKQGKGAARPALTLQTLDGRRVKSLRSTGAVRKFRSQDKAQLRRNFGHLIVIGAVGVYAAYRIWRVACPWVTAGSVAWAAWRFRNSTGRWPTPWEAASWGGGCRVI